ncbi:DDE-type integrase/transposase/recombinase, partial [Corynebacterium striatum]
YRHFARGEVNELWQIDAFVYRLFDAPHTQVTIYQVIDDASRFDVGSQAFGTPENGTDARITLRGAIDAYGLPQEVLSDNGDAFATYHRGRLSQTERWLASLGVQSSAGFAPTTQGKDERSHQTMTRFWMLVPPRHWRRSNS